MKRQRRAIAWSALVLGVLAGQTWGQENPPPGDPPAPPSTPAPTPVVDAKLALSTTLDLAEVPVGQMVQATVTLTNVGESAVTIPKLAEDRQLVSFDVQIDDGATFRFEKIHPSPYAPRTDWPASELAPQASWTLVVPFPALCTGELTITAHYGRQTAPSLQNKPPAVSAAPAKVKMVAAGDASQVQIDLATSMGPIRARLFPRKALGTCLHFARLILEGAKINGLQRQPYYEGLTFHRVIRGFMIQGGCPLGTGTGDPGWSIPAELAAKDDNGSVEAGLQHVPGRLSMARSGHKDSAGSQFFICVGVSKNLDGDYTCFGEVTRGMDVAYTIAETQTAAQDKPLEDVRIERIALRAAR